MVPIPPCRRPLALLGPLPFHRILLPGLRVVLRVLPVLISVDDIIRVILGSA